MFKKIACTLIIAGFAAPAFGEDASLTVAVTEIKEVQGAIMMAVFNAEDAYEGGGPSIKAARIEVDAEEVSVTFEDLPPGRYAIKLYHDANSNGELDTNMMGLPKEPYGFSGKGGRMGPPPFEKAAFDVVAGEDNAVTVRLR